MSIDGALFAPILAWRPWRMADASGGSISGTMKKPCRENGPPARDGPERCPWPGGYFVMISGPMKVVGSHVDSTGI